MPVHQLRGRCSGARRPLKFAGAAVPVTMVLLFAVGLAVWLPARHPCGRQPGKPPTPSNGTAGASSYPTAPHKAGSALATPTGGSAQANGPAAGTGQTGDAQARFNRALACARMQHYADAHN